MVPLQLLVTAILNKSLLATKKKGTNYVAEPLLLRRLMRYFLYTSSDIVTIPKELDKTHMKKAYIFAFNKK
jgi:hypothetical protein